MKEYIERDAVMQKFTDHVKRSNNSDFSEAPTWNQAVQIVEDAPAADVVEVRKIRAFIDKLIAERDKYDLHSMRWKHYDCDRLLIEQMLDEMDGGVNDGKA